MTLPTQHLIRHLFQVDTLEEVSRQQLEQLVEDYPSFGVGRYLLSSKLQAETAGHFREETQKTNLYFSNPFWLQWLLQEQAPSIASSAEPLAGVPAEDVFAPVTDPTEAVIGAHTRHEEEPDEAGWTPLPPAEPEAPPVQDLSHKEVRGVAQENTPEEVRDEIHEQIDVEAAPSPGPSAADLLLQRIAEIKDERQAQRQEKEVPAVQEETAPPMGIAGLALEQMEEEQIEEEHAPTAPAVMEPATEPEIEAPLEMPAPEMKQVEEAPVTEAVTPEEISGPVVQHVTPPADEPAPASPLFEPFHTVDYFASQGIRLVLDENPSDKLGKQMKSFTEWLKVMRRLPQKNRQIVPDIAAERQIQAIAATSIEGREVVTEAMAEVLAKQGMREKATEMYRKLSLLEPEKSAYFATRIEQLKII